MAAPLALSSVAEAATWLGGRVRGTLSADSRRLQPGDGFIAWPGRSSDGRRFVASALQAGAAACLVEAAEVEAFGFDDERVAALPDLRAAAGPVADLVFGQPSRALRMVATTGTNGKTSTAWWTAQALAAQGRRCGVVGTLGIGEPPSAQQPSGSVEANGLTTPDPVALQAALRRFADAGVGACVLEASSIGIEERRLDGTRIELALFTNLSRDHLDYHGSMDAYWQAKRRLFGWPGLRAAVINVDDLHGAALAGELAGGGLDLWTVSAQHADARLHIGDLQHRSDGLAFTVHEGAAAAPVASTLVGAYNVSNLLVVIGALRALGVGLAAAAQAVPGLTPVPGRLQRVGAGATPCGPAGSGVGERVGGAVDAGAGAAGAGPEVLVDYAHTPDALEQVLQALRPLAAARGGRLWCLIGCGGNRDASKRPLMGAIAARLADQVVLTSDNPRDDVPAAILAQMLAGVAGRDQVDVIEDRRAAIVDALLRAANADVVLIAGKGHEPYQEVAGRRLPFSDLDEARAALLQRGRRT